MQNRNYTQKKVSIEENYVDAPFCAVHAIDFNLDFLVTSRLFGHASSSLIKVVVLITYMLT